MSSVVKKTISLPADLAREVEEIAREEGKSVSAVIQEAIRLACREWRRREFQALQDFWSRKARERGILSEADLRRYLES